MTQPERIMIDDVEYLRSDSIKNDKDAETMDGMKYVICRAKNAGVFAGYLDDDQTDGQEMVLKNARRLWYWDGAASLSQLAMEGTSKPDTCKFPCEVRSVKLLEVIEVLDCTEAARLSIKSVKVWVG